MLLTEFPIIYVFTWSPKIVFIEVVPVLEAETIASLSSVTEVRLVQPANTSLPILVTFSGIVIEVRLLQ